LTGLDPAPLHDALPISAEVSSIHIAGNEKMTGVNNIPSPADIMMAQYSIPFCVALAHVRDPRDPRSFDEAALRDPQIRALASRVDRKSTRLNSSHQIIS